MSLTYLYVLHSLARTIIRVHLLLSVSFFPFRITENKPLRLFHNILEKNTDTGCVSPSKNLTLKGLNTLHYIEVNNTWCSIDKKL